MVGYVATLAHRADVIARFFEKIRPDQREGGDFFENRRATLQGGLVCYICRITNRLWIEKRKKSTQETILSF